MADIRYPKWASRVYAKLYERPEVSIEPRRIFNMNPRVDAAIIKQWENKIREVLVALRGVTWTTMDVFRIGTYDDCPPTLLIGARDRTEPLWDSALEKVRGVVGEFLEVELEQTPPAGHPQ